MSLFDDWNSSENQGNDHSRLNPVAPASTAARNPFQEKPAGPVVASTSSQNPFAESNKVPMETDKTGSKTVLSSKKLYSYYSLGEDVLDEDLEDGDGESDEHNRTNPRFDMDPKYGFQQLFGISSSTCTLKQVSVGGGMAILVISTANGASEQVWIWELNSTNNGFKASINGISTLDGKKNQVHLVSICPLGTHVLISLENGDNYYVNVKSSGSSAGGTFRALGPIQRLKDVVFESVAWDRQNQSTESTGDVLIGTSKGGIWEISIDSTKKNIKKVYQLPGMSISICGLDYVRLPVDGRTNKWFVMAATAKPTRFYEFVGGPSLEAMFKSFLAPENQSFRELPGQIGYSQLHCFSKEYDARPESFLLLSEAGLYIGTLSYGSQGSGDKIASRHNMIYFPTKTKCSGEELVGPPLSAIQTEFHYLLLYSSWLIVISKLSEEVVHEQRIDTETNGLTLGFTYDPSQQSVWIYSKYQMTELNISNEDGNVWRLFLDQARDGDPSKFEIALSKCKTENQRDKVLTLRADYHFSQGEFSLAARYYAETKRSFEEVALMLIEKSRRDALKSYLTLKLKLVPQHLKTQRTIIAVWVVELYLEKITSCANHVDVQREFHHFLSDYATLLRPAKDTIYKLIASHGRDEEYLEYAMLNSDYERIVVLHMQRGRHDKAIQTLVEQGHRWREADSDPPPSFVELFYKYSPEFMEKCSTLTVEMWIESPFLDPCKLIPSLIRYSQNHRQQQQQQQRIEEENTDQAIRYLEHCINIQGNQDEAIHNLLVALYARQSDDTYLRELLASPNGRFDLKYALRLCTEHGQKHACVDIYSAMGLYMEAVELALQVDLELAKMNADMAKDQPTRKKLWLLIAEHVIKLGDGGDLSLESTTPVQRALGILRESDAIQVEDLFQFLPDIVAIGDLKTEICHSLEQCGQDIEQLKMEMNDLTKTAETIRKEIDQQNDAFFIVNAGQTCDLCGTFVLAKPFYVFPCTHCFHSTCLLNELSRHLDPSQTDKIELLANYLQLEQQEQDLQAAAAAKAISKMMPPASSSLAMGGGSTLPSRHGGKDDDDDDDDENDQSSDDDDDMDEHTEAGVDDMKRKQNLSSSSPSTQSPNFVRVHDFVTAACPFCGDLMIQSISEPFISQKEREAAKQWEI